MPDARDAAAARLEADGLIRRLDTGSESHGTPLNWRATRRWQGAMARAARMLVLTGEDLEDLRIPIAHALTETYGDDLSDDEIVAMIAVLAPIEAESLAPRARVGAP